MYFGATTSTPIPALALVLLLCTSYKAHAGNFDHSDDPHSIIQIGIAHLGTAGSSSLLHNELRPSLALTALGVPESFDSPGAGSKVIPAQTLALTMGRIFSEHWAAELDVGLPPVVKVRGEGMVKAPTRAGPLFNMNLADPAINPLGSARQWSPALLLQYRLRGNCRQLCPYLGLGAAYTWFTSSHLSPAFDAQLNNQYGASLALAAGKSGPTSTQVRVRPSVSPVFAAGLTSALYGPWGLTVSAAYIPFSTTATVKINAADGTTLSTTTARMKADAFVAALLLSYGW